MIETVPRISIVTPSFNHAEYIEEAVQSVKSRIIRTRNTSSWMTGQVGRSVEILKRLAATPVGNTCDGQRGCTVGRAPLGTRASSSQRTIGWLDDDDRYRPGCLQAVEKAFSDFPELDILYGDSAWINPSGTLTRIRREIDFSHFVLRYHRVLFCNYRYLFSPSRDR